MWAWVIVIFEGTVESILQWALTSWILKKLHLKHVKHRRKKKHHHVAHHHAGT
jgi:hypothetical protein